MQPLEPERILRLEDDAVVLLDQRKLPAEEVEVRCTTAEEVADAIQAMIVRGAPAIGVAAAYGLALAAVRGDDLVAADIALRSSRPTAVNLAWALDVMRLDPSPAVLAHPRGPPLYIVAPSTTVDLATPDGAAIPIVERDPREVTARFTARNPAFDVTPAPLITAIVTEHGVHRAPYAASLAGV